MLTAEEKERYSRQLILKEVGPSGQKKLKNAKALIVGAGGLGSPAIFELACAGIGTIGIADFDVVELNNLNRQFLHNTNDLGKPKVLSAEEKIGLLDAGIKVIKHEKRMDKNNIRDIIIGYDIVLDCSDNFDTKYLINDTCVDLRKTFIHGAVSRFTGQLFTVKDGKGPCLRCIFKEPPPKDVEPACHGAGILGSVAGTIGSLQATEAVKCVLEKGELLAGRLLIVEALDMHIRAIPFKRQSGCIC